MPPPARSKVNDFCCSLTPWDQHWMLKEGLLVPFDRDGGLTCLQSEHDTCMMRNRPSWKKDEWNRLNEETTAHVFRVSSGRRSQCSSQIKNNKKVRNSCVKNKTELWIFSDLHTAGQSVTKKEEEELWGSFTCQGFKLRNFRVFLLLLYLISENIKLLLANCS